MPTFPDSAWSLAFPARTWLHLPKEQVEKYLAELNNQLQRLTECAKAGARPPAYIKATVTPPTARRYAKALLRLDALTVRLSISDHFEVFQYRDRAGVRPPQFHPIPLRVVVGHEFRRREVRA